MPRPSQRGFTIVELLIVIVVIGILAAIVIVAYNGIQTQAQNTSTIAAAAQVKKLFLGYWAIHGDGADLPGIDEGWFDARCVTVTNSCSAFDGHVENRDNTVMLSALKEVGQPPSSVNYTVSGGLGHTYFGLYLDANVYRTYNGSPAPFLLMYWLKGENQLCKVDDTVMPDPSLHPGSGPGSNPFITSTTGRTLNGSDWGDTGVTYCWIHV